MQQLQERLSVYSQALRINDLIICLQFSANIFFYKSHHFNSYTNPNYIYLKLVHQSFFYLIISQN